MLGSNFKIGVLAPAICLALLLAHYHGCSAKGKKPGAGFDDSIDKVTWKDLDPLDEEPRPANEGPSKRSAPRKKNPVVKKVDMLAKNYAGSGFFKNDNGKVEKLPKSFKVNAKSAMEHGPKVLKKNRNIMIQFVKILNGEIERATKGGKGKSSSKLSNSKRTIILEDVTRQAMCIVQSMVGFGFPFKKIPAWRQECCQYPVMRMMAPLTCKHIRPPSPTRPPTTRRPRTRRPKTTTTEPEMESTTSEPETTEAPSTSPTAEPTTNIPKQESKGKDKAKGGSKNHADY